jgi:hypothetical protein
VGSKGSGNWIQRGSKPTVESQNQLDLRWMKKKGCLHLGASGSISWSSGGQQIKTADFFVERDNLVLKFRYGPRGIGESEVKTSIEFDRTPCNYGGARIWFRCGGCSRRTPVVYWIDRYFLCRRCCGLVYQSQNEGQADRLWRKAQEIRTRLGGNVNTFGPFLRPKGMHWRTYWRYRAQVRQLEDRIADIIIRRFGGNPNVL